MQYERAMSEGDGIGYLEEDLEPRMNGQVMALAIPVDALARDIFEDQKRLSGWGHPGIEQRGDIWMLEGVENIALASESLTEESVAPASSRKLKRNRPKKQTVTALSQPDFGHAAFTDFLY